jgi:hypothetical protein
MSYTVKLHSSTADNIVEQVLLRDYQGLSRDITRMELREKITLAPFELQDLADWHEIRDALEKVLGYYVQDWRTKLAKINA